MRLTMSSASTGTFSLAKILRFLGFNSKQLGALVRRFQSDLYTLVPARLTLNPGEIFRIPVVCKELQIVSGVAWISVAGKDIILNAGETVSLADSDEVAILSALGDEPLSLEALLVNLC